MGFSSSVRDSHLLKRGRDNDGNDKDQKLYCESSDEEQTYIFSKRSCSSSNRAEELIGFDGEETMVFTSQQPNFYGSLREETADSESFTSMVYCDSQNFSPLFCGDNYTYTTKMPVLDDAESSTSDSCCCCCCDSCDYDDEYDDDDSDEGQLSSSAPAQSFINYLFEASDDDLGLPPALCTHGDNNNNVMYQNQSIAHFQAVDLDLGLDLDLDMGDHQLLVF